MSNNLGLPEDAATEEKPQEVKDSKPQQQNQPRGTSKKRDADTEQEAEKAPVLVQNPRRQQPPPQVQLEEEPRDKFYAKDYRGSGDFSKVERDAVKAHLNPDESVLASRREGDLFHIVTHPHGRKLSFQATQ